MRKISILCFLVSCFLFTSAFAMTSKDTVTNPGKTVMVSKSKPQFTIKIKANPTTGYSWFLLNYNHNLLQPVAHKYLGPKKAMPGAGGYDEWTFKALPAAFVVPQILAIHLAYARPWQLKNVSTTTFMVVTHDSN